MFHMIAVPMTRIPPPPPLPAIGRRLLEEARAGLTDNPVTLMNGKCSTVSVSPMTRPATGVVPFSLVAPRMTSKQEGCDQLRERRGPQVKTSEVARAPSILTKTGTPHIVASDLALQDHP